VSDVLQYKLSGISPKSYEHPADSAATAALASVPGLDAVIRKLTEFQYERVVRQTLLGGALRTGPDQLRRVWEEAGHAREILDLPDEYDVYVAQDPIANAFTIGAGRPVILLNSGLVSLLEPEELRTVLGHELGHILSQHVQYVTALITLLGLGTVALRLPRLAGLPLLAVGAALLEWYRAAELTCDRAATLVNRDPLTTSRTLMVMAAGMPSKELDLNAFLRQAADYESWSSPIDRFARMRFELRLTHDMPVRRVSEVTAWVRSGEYDRIIGGSFVRRDREPPARKHANEAYRHYKERFAALVKEADEAVGDATGKVADWLGRKDA
jgi:Zn-dependent protease with chaperone function